MGPSCSPHSTVSFSNPLKQVFSKQRIQRRQRTLHYLPKSSVSKRSTDFVAALPGSPLQLLSCKWSWMLFSKECILKRNSHFCLCILSQTLFSSTLHPHPNTHTHTLPLPPAAAIDCIIDANTVTCVRSGGSSSLLLCYTLSGSIKWRKQPHARGGKSACQWSHSWGHFFWIVSSRWLRTKKYGSKFQLMFSEPCHIHYLYLLPTLVFRSRHLNSSGPNSQIFLQIFLRYVPPSPINHTKPLGL